ncbi:MAG: hypothetical protein HGB29_01620 [Chlorobiaceae bacterium]|nr:hypothetical protein [Chlorobiaceae bacterium]
MNVPCMKRFVMMVVVAGLFLVAKEGASGMNREHRATLRRGAEAWNAMRRNDPSVVPDLSHANLRASNLRGVDFSGTILDYVDLGRADLRGAILVKASLYGVVATGANLSGVSAPRVKFSKCMLDEASFSGADLSGASFSACVMRRANFTGAVLKDADLATVDLRESNFDRTDLTGADLRGANLWRVDLRKALTRGMIVSDRTIVDTGVHATRAWADSRHAAFVPALVDPVVATVPEPLFVAPVPAAAPAPAPLSATAPSTSPVPAKTAAGYQSLPVVKQPDSSTTSADGEVAKSGEASLAFSKPTTTVAAAQLPVELRTSDVPAWNRLRRDNLALKAQLRDADLRKKRLAGIDFSNTDLSGAWFISSDLSGADLRGATLHKANLREADLRNADLRQSDLRGAILWRANLAGARLDGASVSGATVLQNGLRATAVWASEHHARFVQ